MQTSYSETQRTMDIHICAGERRGEVLVGTRWPVTCMREGALDVEMQATPSARGSMFLTVSWRTTHKPQQGCQTGFPSDEHLPSKTKMVQAD